MIKYNLKCKNEHEFESWFSNSKEYDNLEKKNILSCQCGKSNNVCKKIMSPQISSRKELNSNQKTFLKIVNKKLNDLRKYVENNAEYVGEKFVTEARSIHYDKKNIRNIYGKATPEEKKELYEEGIETHTVPWLNKTDN